MTVPFGIRGAFESPEERRRRLQQAALGGGPVLDSTRYDQAMEFGDETDAIDQSLNPQPVAPKGILGHLKAAAPSIAAALAENLTGGGGVDRFLSGAGRGFLDQQGRQQEAIDREQQTQSRGQTLKLALLDRTLRQREIDARRIDGQRPSQPSDYDIFRTDPKGYADWKAAGRAPEAAAKPQGLIEVAPGGTLVDPKTFKPVFKASERPKDKPADEKLKFGIAGGIEAVDGMLNLLQRDPSANVRPVGSKMAEGMSHLPIVGGAFQGLAESASQKAMTPSQQEYQNLTESLAHNIAGLLPNKGLAIFKSLRDVYASQSGSSPEARQAKVVLLQRLRRRLEQLQNGEPVTEDDIVNEIHGAGAAAGTPAPPVVSESTRPPSPSTADPSKYFRPQSRP